MATSLIAGAVIILSLGGILFYLLKYGETRGSLKSENEVLKETTKNADLISKEMRRIDEKAAKDKAGFLKRDDRSNPIFKRLLDDDDQ